MALMSGHGPIGRGLVAAVAAALIAVASPARAQEDHRHHHDHEGGPWWHGDIHHFHDHDFDVWRRGRWFHGPHGDRLGWWWIVGGVWYFYPAPVYPYPDPYVPPNVAPPATPPYYYWCSDPPGYYPQVPVCHVPWQATSSGAPPPAAQAPPSSAPAVTSGPACHEYQKTVTVNGQPQQVYGTVCQQPDGSWRIIN